MDMVKNGFLILALLCATEGSAGLAQKAKELKEKSQKLLVETKKRNLAELIQRYAAPYKPGSEKKLIKEYNDHLMDQAVVKNLYLLATEATFSIHLGFRDIQARINTTPSELKTVIQGYLTDWQKYSTKLQTAVKSKNAGTAETKKAIAAATQVLKELGGAINMGKTLAKAAAELEQAVKGK